MPLFAATIFLSAFLLFQIQPVMGKAILPWFGGTPAVWTTCMLFFQSLLLAGYAYAHGVAARLSPRRGVTLHLVLLGLSLLLLARSALDWGSPIVPGLALRPPDSEAPTLRILMLLGLSVGLPYFLLSSTGPLLQHWFARLWPDRSAYRLYALSNTGSLLALVTYPLLVEPALGVSAQGWAWPAGYLVYAAGAATVAVLFARRAPAAAAAANDEAADPADRVTGRQRLLWVALAAAPSVLLLAVTNQISQEVAVVPFLWILPLVLYLLSFILTFESERWYRRGPFVAAFCVASLFAAYALWAGIALGIVAQLGVWSALLFTAAMVCHGELVRLKPHPRSLTGFYLMVSIGGAAGGLLVGVVAPLVFRMYWELHAAIVGVWLLAFAVLRRDRTSFLNRGRFRASRLAFGSTFVALLVLLAGNAQTAVAPWLEVRRNFYGVLRVGTGFDDDPARHGYGLRHGRITHGFQHRAPDKRREPTIYYGRQAGVGRALQALRARASGAGLNVGVIGLGIGTLAGYGTEADRMRFYEINPDVIDFALDPRFFTFLSDAPGEVETVAGDARLSLERELREGGPHRFDLLAVDAFSSDSIPVHLLTREALALYLAHTAPDGVLAFHITNRYLHLAPVVARLAEDAGVEHAIVEVAPPADSEILASRSVWALLARDRSLLDAPAIAEVASRDAAGEGAAWTDDFSDVLGTLRLEARGDD